MHREFFIFLSVFFLLSCGKGKNNTQRTNAQDWAISILKGKYGENKSELMNVLRLDFPREEKVNMLIKRFGITSKQAEYLLDADPDLNFIKEEIEYLLHPRVKITKMFIGEIERQFGHLTESEKSRFPFSSELCELSKKSKSEILSIEEFEECLHGALVEMKMASTDESSSGMSSWDEFQEYIQLDENGNDIGDDEKGTLSFTKFSEETFGNLISKFIGAKSYQYSKSKIVKIVFGEVQRIIIDFLRTNIPDEAFIEKKLNIGGKEITINYFVLAIKIIHRMNEIVLTEDFLLKNMITEMVDGLEKQRYMNVPELIDAIFSGAYNS